jgi:hypothetical protein
MIKKIISGGQTGADRAPLEVAIELGIPHGGWTETMGGLKLRLLREICERYFERKDGISI